MEVSRYKAVTGAIGTRGRGDLGVDLGVIGTSGGEPLRVPLALVEGDLGVDLGLDLKLPPCAT